MLPVSAWPPGPPGASLSPFGKPRDICIPSCGFVLPKGAWIVQTGGNQVVMFRPSWQKDLYFQPNRQMGTGNLPGQQWWFGRKGGSFPGGWGGQLMRAQPSQAGLPPTTATPATVAASQPPTSRTTTATSAAPSSWNCAPSTPRKRPTHDQALERWRAWQRKTGDNMGPIMPIPGRVPPNFAGWRFTGAPATTLIPFGSGGLVLADGQNVVITGGGWANITQAYSV